MGIRVLLLISLGLIGCASIKPDNSTIKWSCISETSNWMMEFIINIDQKTIYFLRSGSLDGQQAFQPETFLDVVYWQNGSASTLKDWRTKDDLNQNITYQTFIFDRGILLSSAHYPTKEYFYDQEFACSAI